MRGPIRRRLAERLEERPILSALKERRGSRDDGDEIPVSETHADEELSLYSNKPKAGISDAEKMDIAWLKRETEARARKDFENIKKHYPELEYDDVFIVTSTAVKMKDGSIYRIPDEVRGSMRRRLRVRSRRRRDGEDEDPLISKQGEEAYCYTCIRDHLHKVQGLLREAEKQWTRDGVVTAGIRRKVALAESELSSAETEHVWNVQLDDPRAQKILDDIGSEISNIRKRLENTQIGFEHPGIPARGGLDDVKKAIADAEALKGQVYNAMVECPTCNLGPQIAERLKR